MHLSLARVPAKAEFLKLINWRIAAEADAAAVKRDGEAGGGHGLGRLLMEVLGANAHVRAVPANRRRQGHATAAGRGGGGW